MNDKVAMTADAAIECVRRLPFEEGPSTLNMVHAAALTLAGTVEELRSALGRPDDEAIETWRAGAKKDAEEITALRESFRVAEDDGHALFWSVYGWPTAHDVPDFPGRDEAMERLVEIGCKARAYDEARDALNTRGYNHLGESLLARVNQALDEVGTVNQHREELGNVLRAVHHRVVGPNRYPVVEAHSERTAKAWEEIRDGLDQATVKTVVTAAETKALAEIASLVGMAYDGSAPSKVSDEVRRRDQLRWTERHALDRLCLASGARPEESALEWIQRMVREADDRLKDRNEALSETMALRTALAEVDSLLDGPTSERRILVERAVQDAQRWRTVAAEARRIDRRGEGIDDDDLVDVVAFGRAELSEPAVLRRQVESYRKALDAARRQGEHDARVICDAWAQLGTMPSSDATSMADAIRKLQTDLQVREGTEVQPSPSGGRKLDDGKAGWNLIPWSALREVVAVLDYGARKYAPDDWRKVPDARRRYHNAAMRHLVASFEGEDIDPESGLPHLAHAAACLLFLRALPVES
mgnify:CR=1 FL=1